MSDGNDLQRQVSRNVKVMMAISDIGTQIALAERLGWDRTVVANRFSGKRGWKLEDLGELAAIFGVRPSDLLGDTAALVGATGTAAGQVKGQSMLPYSVPEPPSVTSSAQVIAFPARDDIGVDHSVSPWGVDRSDAA